MRLVRLSLGVTQTDGLYLSIVNRRLRLVSATWGNHTLEAERETWIRRLAAAIVSRCPALKRTMLRFSIALKGRTAAQRVWWE